MFSRAFALFSLLLFAASASAGSYTFWLSPAPKDEAESALHEALAADAFAGPEAAATRLARMAEARGGSLSAGLARFAAGLAFVEANRSELALAQLRHADVGRTALGDRVQLAIGQALEAQRDAPGAAAAYLAAADTRPGGPVECLALFRAAENLERASLLPQSIETLTRSLSACPGQGARALFDVARLQELRKELPAAAAAYDRLDRDYPASPQARTATRRLAALRALLPAENDEERLARELKKALALCDAGLPSDAAPLLRALKARPLAPADLDLVRVRLGRSALSLTRTREATVELAAIAASSPYAAEAAFYRAKMVALRTKSMQAYEAVANGFHGTPWAEEALLALANNYQKDARDAEALPYYRQLVEGYPDGRYADRAGWRVGWADYRAGRFAQAAQTLERTARLRPTTRFSAGLIYWAGRARLETGDTERARQLFEETVRRFKNSYHGLRAQAMLAGFAKRPADTTAIVARTPDPRLEIPEPAFTRIRQLLLLDQLDAAQQELRTLPPSPLSQATIAWIENREGRLRPAITAMKRAYPEHISAAGDRLPPEVWRILYPLEFAALVRAKAAAEGVDPALVAAIICQESTFNPGAISPAGARGLMQVIPPTGRSLARSLGVRYKTTGLHDPATSLDYGTRYLRQLLDRFGGRVERALAAYNAGPHRVHTWTSDRPEIGNEEFVESIPFSETRQYVMIVLANREHYRRIYDLGAAPERSADAGTPQ